jgi:murein DD-endopeptidase MepM/ murein hydrolase activator NlpD
MRRMLNFFSPATYPLPLTTVFLVLAVTLAGCAPYQRVEHSAPLPPTSEQGVLHRVAQGETLWRIAKRYGVDLQELARVNRISNPAKIKAGQRLMIPDSATRKAKPAPKQFYQIDKPIGSRQFAWPVEGKVIGLFGTRQGAVANKGIDIQASSGTAVAASRGGQVSFVHDSMPGLGKTIIVDHADGYATVYGYIGEILVHAGDKVKQRQVIARVGRNVRTNVAALHFEIRRQDKPQNPLRYLP